MSKLDDIYDGYKREAGWARLESTNPERTRNEAWLSGQIKALFLELIGEDEPFKGEYEDECDQESRNGLRAELRKKVEEL